MRTLKTTLIVALLSIHHYSFSQELDKSATISLFAGAINYQGDLKPNSFTLKHSNIAAGFIIRKPLNRWFTFRAGMNFGKIEAADKWNREYLKPRNLSFTTSIREIYTALEISVLDISANGFTPYIYGGVSAFHFNPWAKDNNGVKTYLKPLSTEGQGLSQFPGQKPYNLNQFALAFGMGAKFAINEDLSIGIEFNQRKSFTDYIDDVSSHYVDRDILLQERGSKAVEMAYRGGQSPVGSPNYPVHGEQRGTPSEMDWYYFIGFTIEQKLNSIGGLFQKGVANQRCPRNIGY